MCERKVPWLIVRMNDDPLEVEEMRIRLPNHNIVEVRYRSAQIKSAGWMAWFYNLWRGQNQSTMVAMI